MNYFDIFIAVPLLWAIYRGFKKGLIIEVASLVALVLGIWGSLNFSDYAATLINENWEVSAKWLPILAFSLTFILIVIAVFSLAKLLEKVVKMVALGLPNRILGALFGALKVVMLLSVIFYLLGTVHEKYPFLPEKALSESLLFTPIQKIAPALLPHMREWSDFTL
jgi:membrane protein required for colicin V production